MTRQTPRAASVSLVTQIGKHMTDIETHRASRPGYPALVTHRFTVTTEQPHWSRRYDVATCGPYRATSLKSSAAHKLARIMVAAGEPNGPVEVCGPDGRIRFAVRSLAAFAKFTLSETPRPHLARYQEHPRAQYPFGVSGGSEDRRVDLMPEEAEAL